MLEQQLKAPKDGKGICSFEGTLFIEGEIMTGMGCSAHFVHRPQKVNEFLSLLLLDAELVNALPPERRRSGWTARFRRWKLQSRSLPAKLVVVGNGYRGIISLELTDNRHFKDSQRSCIQARIIGVKELSRLDYLSGLREWRQRTKRRAAL